VRKPLLILAVHLCEVGHVGNEDLRSALQMSAYLATRLQRRTSGRHRKELKQGRQTGRQKTYTNPHYLVHTAAGRFEDGFQIAAALGRLLGDGALDQVALGVGGDLAGTPDLAGSFDGLAVWSCCCWWEGGRVSKW
jgi:hypothetical protein